ncbi:hypothetical protein [Streptomyces sp. NPDC049585]|uniref:hypothetical protein n=1 Tax=Streptomyces sp. NPDC049585 TaxID=3155154 RepID=UPI00343C93FF
MTRTTPPRPLEIAAVFPELTALARTTTRLHPRPGAPTVGESSVGGPLLWPVGEAWPVCEEGHEVHRPVRLEDVGTLRRILTAGWARSCAAGEDFLTPEERETVQRINAGLPASALPAGPVPLIPVAQLYARDVPDLFCPEGTDLLQVLWCPFDHGDAYVPAVHLRWRRAADVEAVLTEPPRPEVVGSQYYVPAPCVLHPEQVVEYPAGDDLPEGLCERIHAWEDQGEGRHYQYDLSVAPGWKAGGWAAWWTFTDPWPFPLSCPCGAPVEPLLTLDGAEWDGGSGSWRPVEDTDVPGRPPYPSLNGPTHISIGRGYTLQVYRCTASAGHGAVTHMQ